MRVALLTTSFLPRVGGKEYVVHHLANTLHRIGCTVTVFAKRKPEPDNFEHAYELVRFGHHFRGSQRIGLDIVSCVLRVFVEHRRSSFDVLNCHGVAYSGRYGLCANKFMRVPIVMTPHGQDIQRVPEINYGIRLNPKWNRNVMHNLRKADAITAISDSVKEELDFVSQEKIFAIPNGIHRGNFSTGEGFYLHDFLNISHFKKIVLSVGRNHIKKGYKYGIQAFAQLRDLNWCQDAVYVIIGRGVTELSGLVEELCLQNRVFLVDEISSDLLNHCYNSSSLFFSPSIIEGLSIVSIEAMSCGLPLVVTDVPGNRDVVRDNDCGIIVPSKDILSMAGAIRKVLTEEDLRQEYAARSLRRSIRYDWENIAQMYLEVYKNVIDQKRIVNKNTGCSNA